MNKKWFTLIELVISVSIISILTIWIWWFLVKISDNFYNNSNDLNIYNEIITFQNDITKLNLTWWILIKWDENHFDSIIFKNTYNSWWLIISIFDKNTSLIDNQITNSKNYNNYHNLWYFFIDDYLYIASNTWSIYSSSFNRWQIFPKTNIYDFNITEFDNKIYKLNIKTIKKIQNIWNSKTTPKNEDILDFNLYF